MKMHVPYVSPVFSSQKGPVFDSVKKLMIKFLSEERHCANLFNKSRWDFFFRKY